jgi:gliding motility-associated-like protein
MDSNFTNIDEAFKNAFHNAEAPYSQAEMNAGWQQVSKQLSPVQPPQHTSPHHIAGQAGSSIAKIIGFSGLGAAVITSAVILYNIYVRPVEPKHNPTVATEQPVISKNKEIENNTDRNSGTIPGKVNKEKSNLKGIDTHSWPVTGDKTTASGDQQQNTPFQDITSPVNTTTTPPANNRPGNGSTHNPKQNPFARIAISDSNTCVNSSVSVSTGLKDKTVSINWGDGNVEMMNGMLLHTYSKAGKYKIQVNSENGEISTYISVTDKPKARFSEQEKGQLKCIFNNQSSQSGRYVWNFGDGSVEEYDKYVEHTYPDTGKYQVRLVAFNAGGCADTFTQFINVINVSEPHISSNAITPNGDNLNDDVYVIIKDETYFTFTVVDRSGQIVFQTTDKNRHWAGKNQSTGSDCPAGSYFFSATYILKTSNQPQTIRGSITLFR